MWRGELRQPKCVERGTLICNELELEAGATVIKCENPRKLAGIAGLQYRNSISAVLSTLTHSMPLSSVQAGETPLFYASLNGHVAVVQLLLQNNADISICKEVHLHIYNNCNNY